MPEWHSGCHHHRITSQAVLLGIRVAMKGVDRSRQKRRTDRQELVWMPDCFQGKYYKAQILGSRVNMQPRKFYSRPLELDSDKHYTIDTIEIELGLLSRLGRAGYTTRNKHESNCWDAQAALRLSP